jgi:hypothetical protein
VSADESVACRFEGSDRDPPPDIVSQEQVVMASARRREAIQKITDRLDRHARCAVSR